MKIKIKATDNTDGIIHKIAAEAGQAVTVFADHCFLPGYCPPLYPDTQLRFATSGKALSSMSDSSATGINFLLSIEVCEAGAAPLLSTRFTTGDKFVIPI